MTNDRPTRKERMEYSSVIAAGIFASMSENWFDADESVVTSAIKVTLLLEKRWAEIEGNEKRFLENPRFDTPSPAGKENVEVVIDDNDIAF